MVLAGKLVFISGRLLVAGKFVFMSGTLLITGVLLVAPSAMLELVDDVFVEVLEPLWPQPARVNAARTVMADSVIFDFIGFICSSLWLPV